MKPSSTGHVNHDNWPRHIQFLTIPFPKSHSLKNSSLAMGNFFGCSYTPVPFYTQGTLFL